MMETQHMGEESKQKCRALKCVWIKWLPVSNKYI